MFYKYSKLLHSIIERAKFLLPLWSYRYSVLVDESDRGLDCPYAIKSMRLARDSSEAALIRAQLTALRDDIDSLLAYDDSKLYSKLELL